MELIAKETGDKIAMKMFASGIEGAQHGDKGLEGFVGFAHAVGAAGCQPSNFMVNATVGGFVETSTIRKLFGEAGLTLQGISCHCPFWVLLTAWTGSPTIRPFISPDLANGDLNLVRFTETMLNIGYPQRYCKLMGAKLPRWWLKPKVRSRTSTKSAPTASNSSTSNAALMWPKARSKTAWAPKSKRKKRSTQSCMLREHNNQKFPELFFCIGILAHSILRHAKMLPCGRITWQDLLKNLELIKKLGKI